LLRSREEFLGHFDLDIKEGEIVFLEWRRKILFFDGV